MKTITRRSFLSMLAPTVVATIAAPTIFLPSMPSREEKVRRALQAMLDSEILTSYPRHLASFGYAPIKAEGQLFVYDEIAQHRAQALRDSMNETAKVSIDRYLADPNSWYIKTPIPDGLKYFNRRRA